MHSNWSKAVLRALQSGNGRSNRCKVDELPERLTEDGVTFDPADLPEVLTETGGLRSDHPGAEAAVQRVSAGPGG